MKLMCVATEEVTFKATVGRRSKTCTNNGQAKIPMACARSTVEMTADIYRMIRYRFKNG